MSIGIETNLSLICSAFNISYTKITNEYSGMTIEEIMEEEKAQGNELAAKFTTDLLNKPEKLIEFIELNNPTNKFAILSHMNENDLSELMPLLENEDMAIGLNFFSMEKLLDMIAQLPGEEGAKLSLQMFSPEHLMALMPKEAIDEVLSKREVREMRGLEMESIKLLPPEVLAQMIEVVTGDIPEGVGGVNMLGEVNFDIAALQKQIGGFNSDDFQEALYAIPEESKKYFMFNMVDEEPKLWGLFDSAYFADIIGARQKKEDIVDVSAVIGHEYLVAMNNQLPQELMAVVLTQIDSEELAKILQKDFRDVIGQLSLS